jgi:PAS domain S-box-containing protein
MLLEAALFTLLLATLALAVGRLGRVRALYGAYAVATNLWLAAWIVLVLSGLLAASAATLPNLAVAVPFLRTLFAWGTLAGAWVVATSHVPAWVLPAGILLGSVGSGLELAGAAGTGHLTSLFLDVPPLVGAGLLLRRRPGPLTLRARALGPLHLAMAALVAVASVLGHEPDSAAVLAVALVVAPALFLAQFGTVADLRRSRTRREREELERSFTARTEELAALNRSLRQEVERHQATEKALRKSEKRHRLVSEMGSDFIFEMRVNRDRGLEPEWVSGAFERITGHPSEALQGWAFVSLLAPEQQDETRSLVAGFEGRGSTRVFEREIQTPAGQKRLLKIQVVSIREDGGDLRVVGGASDVTEPRRAARERESLEQQLQDVQRLESLGVLTGGIAHDFNNLLAVILGNLRLALEEIPEDSAARGRLGRARSAGEHAARLTEQMLAYSGKASVSLAPTDLSELVRETEDLLHAALAAPARLEFELAPDAVVEGDATRLRQVLLNLVANAGESLAGGRGTVTVRTWAEEASPEDCLGWLGEAPDGRCVFLEVADDGCGMPPNLRRRIFDPFFTTRFSGRGLGLASVLGIAKAHGGAIRVESKVGQGTSLRVRMPAARRALAAEPPRDGALRGTGCVLVIDDDEAVLELAEAFLERSGHSVITALGGRVGVELFRERPDQFDAVLLDLGMPDLDGEQVFAELRSIRPDVPVVLATGYTEEHAAERFAASGVAGFLGKPYEAEELVEAIARARSGPSE